MKHALRNLLRNPKRTALVFVTLAVGAGALFGFRALNGGVLAEYREVSIHSRYGHGTLFKKGYWGKSLESPWQEWIARPAPRLAHLKANAAVANVFPRVSFTGLLTNGDVTLNGVGLGVDGPAEKTFFDRLGLVAGEFLDGTPDGIVLGRGLADSLNVKPGATMTLMVTTVQGSLNANVFTVKGIFETGVKAIDDTAFRIELPAAQTLLDTTAVESISVALKTDGAWPRFEEPGLESFSFEELDQVYYQNGARWLKSQAGVFEKIILFIVLLGIFNAIAVSILERAPELGVARANGESRRDIFRALMVEASLLGIGAAAIGMGGVWLLSATLLRGGLSMPPAPGMTRASLVFLRFLPNDALTVGALCLVTVLIGASLVAVKVLRLSIVSSLRPQ